MRFTITFILSILWVLSSYSQEFGTHWISYPLPNDSAEVWFRKSYIIHHQSIQAFANIASTGYYRLYINERNVTGSLLFEGIKDGVLQSRTFDVTRYLKNGENIIAVWYAPRQGEPSHGKQLSLEFYGWDQDSTAFHYQTDGTWLVRQLQGCSNGEDEIFDGRTNILAWKSDEYRPYGWVHPTGSYEPITIPDSSTMNKEKSLDKRLAMEGYPVIKAENKLYKVLQPVATYTDSLGYNIDFGRPFHGSIRLTLRNAKKGDHIYINGYRYTCNGELDEQAFFRFKFQDQRIYTLTWSDRFRRSDIVNIEGLEISD